MKKPWIICWGLAMFLLIGSSWAWQHSVSLTVLDTPILIRLGHVFASLAIVLFGLGLWLQGRYYRK